MNTNVKIILLTSAIVAILISVIVFFITKAKVKKIKTKYLEEESKKYDHVLVNNVPETRGDKIGELLWDLRDATKNPLDDVALEFIINTSIRNGYKTFALSKQNNYVNESLIKLAKLQPDKNSNEFIVIWNSEDVNDTFDNYYKKLSKGGMIFIVDAPRKGQIKKLLSYTKLTGIRSEYYNFGKGLVIIAK